MNQLKITVCLIISVLSISCAEKQKSKDAVPQMNDSINEVKNDIPVAFEDEGFIAEAKSFSRFGRNYGNIVDRLFEDYLENDENLEQTIQTFQSLSTEAENPKGQIKAYLHNNEHYYNTVIKMLEFVRDGDTVICDLMLKKIKTSEKNFNIQSGEFERLEDEEIRIIETWETYLTVMKVLKTLEMVEKYQMTESIDQNPYIEIMNEQKMQINKIKSQIKLQN